MRWTKKFFNEKSLTKTKKYNEDFKPRLGTYIISNEPLIEKMSEGQEADIISNEPVAEKVSEEKETDIHFISAGFDQSKLEQIINLFINKENSD